MDAANKPRCCGGSMASSSQGMWLGTPPGPPHRAGGRWERSPQTSPASAVLVTNCVSVALVLSSSFSSITSCSISCSMDLASETGARAGLAPGFPRASSLPDLGVAVVAESGHSAPVSSQHRGLSAAPLPAQTPLASLQPPQGLPPAHFLLLSLQLAGQALQGGRPTPDGDALLIWRDTVQGDMLAVRKSHPWGQALSMTSPHPSVSPYQAPPSGLPTSLWKEQMELLQLHAVQLSGFQLGYLLLQVAKLPDLAERLHCPHTVASSTTGAWGHCQLL